MARELLSKTTLHLESVGAEFRVVERSGFLAVGQDQGRNRRPTLCSALARSAVAERASFLPRVPKRTEAAVERPPLSRAARPTHLAGPDRKRKKPARITGGLRSYLASLSFMSTYAARSVNGRAARARRRIHRISLAARKGGTPGMAEWCRTGWSPEIAISDQRPADGTIAALSSTVSACVFAAPEAVC
jgi:hypothetical protein